VYSVGQFPVTPATVIAFLTILGYSLYDTVVVFDKVEENDELVSPDGNLTYSGMVNLSLNQTLMRSINTTITACTTALMTIFAPIPAPTGPRCITLVAMA
jgi:preprotein translocase subunit SecF